MHGVYWFDWAMSALFVIGAANGVLKYVKTKEKKFVAQSIFYLVGATCFLWIGNYNRKRQVREAEHEVRDQMQAAKNKMMRVEVRSHTPEEAATAVMTFVSDLNDRKLAESLARASEDYRVAWQKYVRSCTDLADELKALGPAAPDTLWWVNGVELPPTAELPDQLRQNLQAVQTAAKALEAVERRHQVHH